MLAFFYQEAILFLPLSIVVGPTMISGKRIADIDWNPYDYEDFY